MNAAPIRTASDRAWRTLRLVATLPVVLAAILWIASEVGDSNRVPAELAAAARETGVMYCTEGAVAHDDASFWDRLVGDGTFRCTGWTLRGRATSSTTGAVGWPSSPRR